MFLKEPEELPHPDDLQESPCCPPFCRSTFADQTPFQWGFKTTFRTQHAVQPHVAEIKMSSPPLVTATTRCKCCDDERQRPKGCKICSNRCFAKVGAERAFINAKLSEGVRLDREGTQWPPWYLHFTSSNKERRSQASLNCTYDSCLEAQSNYLLKSVTLCRSVRVQTVQVVSDKMGHF